MRLTFQALSGLGLVFGIISNGNTADLYENNAHHTIGWFATCIMAVQAAIDLLLRFAKRTKTITPEGAGLALSPLADTVRQNTYLLWSGSSDQLTESSASYNARNTPPINSHDLGEEFDRFRSEDDDDGYRSLIPGRLSFFKNYFIHKYLSGRVPTMASYRTLLRTFEVLYGIIDRTILALGFVTLLTGGVTYAGIFVSG